MTFFAAVLRGIIPQEDSGGFGYQCFPQLQVQERVRDSWLLKKGKAHGKLAYVYSSRVGWHSQTPFSNSVAIIMVLKLLPGVPGHLAEEGSSETQAICSHSTAQTASEAQGAALEKQPCLHGYPSTGGCTPGAGFVIYV